MKYWIVSPRSREQDKDACSCDNILFTFLAIEIRQEKIKIKDIWIGKEKFKVFLYKDEIIL
jgi:hypothetical protein